MELAGLGAEVILVARDATGLDETRSQLSAGHGQQHQTISVDFDRWEEVQSKVGDHLAGHAPVEILLNNSGGPPGGPAHEATPQQYQAAFQRHLIGNQVMVQAVLPGMRKCRFGRIINIISTSVVTPIKGLGVSNTIRGAVANWGRTLANELGPLGITVNNILPGFTATQRLTELFTAKASRLGRTVEEIEAAAIAGIPTGRLGAPEEIAVVVGFLASPAAQYVNGVNLPVDGGRLAAQ